MGSLYKQSGSRIWWVKYYSNGRPVRESAGTADEREAERFLKRREGQVAAGQPLLPRLDRVRRELERCKKQIVPWLFPHLEPRLAGQRIRDFRKAWAEVGVAPVWWRVNCFRDRHCTVPAGDTEIAPPWSIVDPEVTVRSPAPCDCS